MTTPNAYRCPRCGWQGWEPASAAHRDWHARQDALQRARDDEEQHARGHHDDQPLDGCPICDDRRNRTA